MKKEILKGIAVEELLNQLPLCQDLQRIIEPSQKLTTVQDKMAMAVAAQPYVVAMLVPAAMMMPSNAQVGSEIGQEVKRSGFLKLRNLRMAFELELFENLILHRFSLLRRVKRQREFCRFLEVPSGTPSNSDGYTPHWGQDNCERFFQGSFHSLCFFFWGQTIKCMGHFWGISGKQQCICLGCFLFDLMTTFFLEVTFLSEDRKKTSPAFW